MLPAFRGLQPKVVEKLVVIHVLVGLLCVVFVQHFGEEKARTHAMAFTRWQVCGRFLPSASSALVPPQVDFTAVVGTEAPNICIERHSFSREIPAVLENIRRRQDRRYRLIVSYRGRCYRCNQLLKDGPRDQGSVHPMTGWVK